MNLKNMMNIDSPAYADSDVDDECDDILCLIFVRGDNHFGSQCVDMIQIVLTPGGLLHLSKVFL